MLFILLAFNSGRLQHPVGPPVIATHSAPTAKVEFLRDVAPILDRTGCSTAECHGKFGGRGGFQLSLMTLSPEDDYAPIVDGGRGRRVDFKDPKNSLLLLKATGAIEHGGGMRFAVGSPQYRTLLAWIQQGAPFDDKDPRVTSLVITPGKVTLHKVGAPQKLRVQATYTDGSRRDVTSQSTFISTNPAALSVTKDGVVTGTRWGGGAILARYLGTIASSSFTLPQQRDGPYPSTEAYNIIDKLVQENLKRLNVVPSRLTTDFEFVRRVTLDTLGRLPTAAEVSSFAADKAPDKRARLIDALLEKPEFADFRALRLADLLRVHPRKLGDLGDRSATLFYDWIWNSVSENKPWDKFVREIITARGSTYHVGPANFYRIETEPNDRMENVGQAFLGVRMSCARCHKHPFDRWTTDDYWNFAAFCGKVSTSNGRLYNETIISLDNGAQVNNQSVNGRNRGKPAPPTFLGEKTPAPEKPDQIQALADWVTAPNNPFFARATVNRLWSYYLGKGIVNPVDDMRATTPESVPGLLDALAQELVKNRYDTKQVIRVILNSRTYQTSAAPNPTNIADDRFFSRFMPRPMPAAVLLDMVNAATGTDESFGSFTDRSRAIQAAFPPDNYFLDVFGQSHREFLADINPRLEPNLVQTLHMIDSPYIDGKVRGGSTVDEIVKSAKSEPDVVTGLYARTLCRPPTPQEDAKGSELIRQAGDRKEGAQDLLWALVTSREFYFNH